MELNEETTRERGRPKKYFQKRHISFVLEDDIFSKMKYLAERDCGGNLTKYMSRIMKKWISEKFTDDDMADYEEYIEEHQQE